MTEANKVLVQLFEKNTITLTGLGRQVIIKKTTLRTLRPAMEFIGRMIEDLRLDGKNLPTVDLTDTALILKLISKYFDDVVKVVVLHSDVTEEELLDMSLDESAVIVQGVVLLNKDFFMKRVLPNLLTSQTEEEQPPAQQQKTEEAV